MARTTGRSGFKMRSGNKPGFKNMGSFTAKMAQIAKDKASDTMQDMDLIKAITNPDLHPETRKITQRIYKDVMYKNKKDSPADLKSFGFAKGTSPITEKIDWSQAPPAGTQERIDWYKKHNLALDETTKLKETPKENKNQEPNTDNNKNTGNEVDDSAGAEKGTGQPKMSKGAAIGSILASSLTGGLDAVYGTGRVHPGGTQLKFSKDDDEKKKQKTTGEVEEEIDKKTKIS